MTLILLLISAVGCYIINLIAGAWLGSKELGWIVGGFFFLCSLPWIIIQGIAFDISNFFEGLTDRVDDALTMQDFNADMRAMEREEREDERLERQLDAMDRRGNTYIDNRQVNIYEGDFEDDDDFEDDFEDDLEDDDFEDDDY